MIRPNKEKRSKSMVADWEKVQGWGWDGDRLASELIKFRQETMDELPPEFEPDPTTYVTFSLIFLTLGESSPRRRNGLTDSGISSLWLRDDFEKAKEGKFHYGVRQASNGFADG